MQNEKVVQSGVIVNTWRQQAIVTGLGRKRQRKFVESRRPRLLKANILSIKSGQIFAII